MNHRAAVIAALDAIRLDDAAEAEAILDSVLEDGPTERPLKCPECGLGFEWAGLRDHHMRFVHWDVR